MTRHTLPPATVIEQFGLDRDSIALLSGGHINQSFLADRGSEACVLQRVNPVFPAAINADIDAVTQHLAAKGLTTPRLLPAHDGRLFLETGDGVWRLLSRIAGETHELLGDAREAAEAGRVLGEFHAALTDFDRPLSVERPGVHNLDRHLDNLRHALAGHRDHAARKAVLALARDLYDLHDALPPPPSVPRRLVHGDPKISNVIFRNDRAVCLVDLDTIARMPAPIELGDALRSWCNPMAEDSPDSHFAVDRFDAALAGYAGATGAMLAAAEWRAIPVATLTVAIGLAARFAADALNESYFGWDAQRFGSASEHNLARARAQLTLAGSIAELLPELDHRAMTLP